MADYQVPLRDLYFVLDELLNSQEHYQKLGLNADFDMDLRNAILDEAAKFAEQVVAPINRAGDEQGCTFNNGEVTTPEGFANAYQQFIAGGWSGLVMPEEYGGQNLPESLEFLLLEMIGSASHAWAQIHALSGGCRATILAAGSEAQKQTYLTKMTSGEWSGTMCLTEPQCGSDLSFLKTQAIPQEDGSYHITGTKIFISSGEQDITDNIVHMVLARTPGAPAGTKGISLFIVPKYLPQADGSAGERNSVSCGSIEHKMGIHGSATCVMNFDAAKGFLIGEENAGLACMFVFMNTARVGTSLEASGHMEYALQGASRYALEREAGRALSGVKAPEKNADPLIVHPDVRRMLLTIRSLAEGSRAFNHYLGQLIDIEHLGTGDAKKMAQGQLALLTPIAKGFTTEVALEAANLGIQVFGGHGYIAEWGMEQNYRDAKISTLYEGTTGIQALDLVGRKVLRDKAQQLGAFIDIITADLNNMDPEFAQVLQPYLPQWLEMTKTIATASAENPDEIGAASVDYLMYSGFVVFGWMWGKMGSIASKKLQEDAFYRVKYATAQFYFSRMLPRAKTYRATALAGANSLMALSDDDLATVCL